MKKIQGAFISGYVTVRVKGIKPELFFQHCVKNEINVWQIEKKSQTICHGKIKYRDVQKLKQIRRTTGYKLSFIGRQGSPFLLKRFMRKRELVLGVILSLLLIFALSNILWKVNVTGVPKDIEKKIIKQLDQYGIRAGSWSLTLEPASRIQQKLVSDIPELLWVGVEKKGTTYQIKGIEKATVKEKKVSGPQNLIATKKGIIKRMFISKGLKKKEVHDYVEQGDLLVTGKLDFTEEESDDTDKDDDTDEHKLIAAKGDVIAETWYKVDVTVPLKANVEMLTGHHKKNYSLGMGRVHIPIWGLGEPDYTSAQKEVVGNPIHFFKWDLPIHFLKTTWQEKNKHQLDRSKQEAIKIGLQQAEQELKLRLGPEADIRSQKVLHDTIENGKVKLTLFSTVEENIAKAEPIAQGD